MPKLPLVQMPIDLASPNMMLAMAILAEIEPALRPVLAAGRIFSALAHDRLSLVPSKVDARLNASQDAYGVT